MVNACLRQRAANPRQNFGNRIKRCKFFWNFVLAGLIAVGVNCRLDLPSETHGIDFAHGASFQKLLNVALKCFATAFSLRFYGFTQRFVIGVVLVFKLTDALSNRLRSLLPNLIRDQRNLSLQLPV